MILDNIKVLVVDDDQLLRETLSDLLELDGAIVDLAADGAIAFEMIKNNDYNIVITDVRMPNCSGIDLMHMIRDYDQKTPEIIMMSAFSDLTEQKARELGAAALFLKPTKIAEIKTLILELV